jgi:hypothetical protein
VGSDIRKEFWEPGYGLFNDKDSLKSEFVEAGLLADDGLGASKVLEGKVDVVFAGSLLHLLDCEGQVIVVEKIVALLLPAKGGHGARAPSWAYNCRRDATEGGRCKEDVWA